MFFAGIDFFLAALNVYFGLNGTGIVILLIVLIRIIFQIIKED